MAQDHPTQEVEPKAPPTEHLSLAREFSRFFISEIRMMCVECYVLEANGEGSFYRLINHLKLIWSIISQSNGLERG